MRWRRATPGPARTYCGSQCPPGTHGWSGKSPRPRGRPVVAPVDPSGWAAYGRGRQFLAALADSRAARAVWQALPGELWADRFAEAAAQTVRAGRTVLAIVPDQRDLDTLWQAATALVDEHSVVALSAGLGPEARYRRWLAALRGSARLVIGTRSAVFAPLSELGLVMVWADATTPWLSRGHPIRTPVRWRCCGRIRRGAQR